MCILFFQTCLEMDQGALRVFWWSQCPSIELAHSLTPLLHLHWALCGYHGPEQENGLQKGAAPPLDSPFSAPFQAHPVLTSLAIGV